MARIIHFKGKSWAYIEDADGNLFMPVLEYKKAKLSYIKYNKKK